MSYSDEQKQYYNKKPGNVVRYLAFTFYHPDFGYKRLVANQLKDKTLGGNVFTAASMKAPAVTNQSTDDANIGSISFGRIGQQFREAIDQITPVGAIKYPIDVKMEQYLSTDTANNIFERDVYVAPNGISISSESVNVRLTVDNPQKITEKDKFYDPTIFIGLSYD